jgi:mono/diheme cytochrome c family protein
MRPRSPCRPIHLHILVIALGFVQAGGAPSFAQEKSPPANERVQAQTPETSPTPKPAPKPLVIPASEKNRKNPVPNVPEALDSGKSLYNSQCAMCHGPRGDGRGDLALSLKMKIPNLADPKVQEKRTDGEWFYILSQGHFDMPAEKRLVDQNKWEMILYMRTLVKPAS